MYPKAKGTTVPSDAQAREKLNLYVYEYLVNAGATRTAQSFLNEIRWEKNITLGDPPGFLANWWCVFWDLYCAAPEKRDTNEHSSEAKAFHDYFSPDGGPPPTGPPPGNFFPSGQRPQSASMPGQPMPGQPLPGHPTPPPGHPMAGHQGIQMQYRYGPRPPIRQQMAGTPTGSAILPSSMDPMRQHAAGRMMMPGQPGTPPNSVQRMTPHGEAIQQQRIPMSQAYHPAMRPGMVNHSMSLPLQNHGMPGMPHGPRAAWGQPSPLSSHASQTSAPGTPVTPGPGPPHLHLGHPYMQHQPLSNKSGSPRTPLDPCAPDSLYNHQGQPVSIYGASPMANGSIPMSGHGPLHPHPHPLVGSGVPTMNDGHHDLRLHKVHDGPDEHQNMAVPNKSDVGGFPLNFREDGFVENASASHEIQRIEERLGQEAKQFEKPLGGMGPPDGRAEIRWSQ
ncbi:single-stranded DNA-binding protein 3-like [Corticium candelabrum]|uniref:single-stranded DNA-binding protein 3-like n=1 Tax=Corticium candelabrum TaxID=121492 RepID=UPI002E26E244|nr:single-stranded DNA-binding protein 3-like [Corticium candelabrum]